MKRTTVLILAVCILMLSTITVSAEPKYGGLNEFMKSSYSDFEGKGGVSKSVESLVTFDSIPSGLSVASGVTLDRSNKKQGSASLKMVANGGYFNNMQDYQCYMHTMFSGTPGFNIDVTDIMSQTIGMWFYVDNVDNLVCDHDKVAQYNRLQDKSGTVYFKLGNSSRNFHQWNHSFYGSGWHYIEFALNSRENTTTNPNYNWTINYNDMKFIEFRFETRGTPVVINVDEISLITYKTSKQKPTAPYGGKWISTCDFNVFDGATVTEWMGAYFDRNNKTEGASSLMIRGRGEHVDYRAVFSGYDEDLIIDLNNDYLIFDLYCSDVDLLGHQLDFVFYGFKDYPFLSINYWFIYMYSESGELRDGWNKIKIPLFELGYTGTFSVERLKIYWYSTDKTTWYTVGYDNIYVAPRKNVENPNFVNPKPVEEPADGHKPVVSAPTSKPSTVVSSNILPTPSSTVKPTQSSTSNLSSTSSSEVSQIPSDVNDDSSADSTTEVVTPSEPVQSKEVTESQSVKEEKSGTLLWIILSVAAALIVAAGVTVWIILKKKPIHKEN